MLQGKRIVDLSHEMWAGQEGYGLDCAEYPLDRLIGPACRLDFRHRGDSELITLEEVSAYDDLIQRGDIVFLWTGRWAKRGTPEGHARPCLSPEATLWLARD